MKVLIVDDSKTMRKMIRGPIDALGYDIIEAGSCAEAMQLIEREYKEIGLITLDVNMPETDGITCLAGMRENDKCRSIPVIMVTSEGERELLLQAIKLGAKHYVTKPFSAEDLTSRILDVLERGENHGVGF